MAEQTTIAIPTQLYKELEDSARSKGMLLVPYLLWLIEQCAPVFHSCGQHGTPGEQLGRRIKIATTSRRYETRVGAGLLAGVGEALRALGLSGRARLIADAGVPTPTVELVRAGLVKAGFTVDVSSVPADEAHKSLAGAQRLYADMLASRHERNDPVVSIGGGVVSDLAGFVAATYRRGVPVIHCPTTLLAMVDAAIGGKAGVNLPMPGGAGGDLAKNMVGAFWQPRLVVCDVDALTTLPRRHLRAGMGECLKHGLISAGLGIGQGRDEQLWTWTQANLARCLALETGALTELIARNIAVKAGVVGADEREEAPAAQGGRALLNLGHTYAHAIETLPGLSVDQGGGLQHGEAVAYGLVAAAGASRHMGWLTDADCGVVHRAVGGLGLPPTLAGLPSDEVLLERMRHDKKAAGGKLRLVLLKRLGEACMVDDPVPETVRAGWAAIRR